LAPFSEAGSFGSADVDVPSPPPPLELVPPEDDVLPGFRSRLLPASSPPPLLLAPPSPPPPGGGGGFAPPTIVMSFVVCVARSPVWFPLLFAARPTAQSLIALPVEGAVTLKRNVADQFATVSGASCTISPKLSRRPATFSSFTPSVAATPPPARARPVVTTSVYSATCPALSEAGPVIVTVGAVPPVWH